MIEIVPIHLGNGDLVFDQVTVFGAAAREGAGADDEGAGVAECTFFPAQAIADEFFRRKLVVDGIGDTQAKADQIVRREGDDRH